MFLLFDNDLTSHNKNKLRETDIINCRNYTRVGNIREEVVFQDELIIDYP